MIKKILDDPRKWTPIFSALSAAGTVMVSIVAFFLLRTLNQFDDSIKDQTKKMEVIAEKFHENELKTETRFGKLEMETRLIDARVDRFERSKRM